MVRFRDEGRQREGDKKCQGAEEDGVTGRMTWEANEKEVR